MTKAISEQSKGNSGCTRLFLFVWSLGFGGGGLLFLWLTVIQPMLQSKAAADWSQTQCTILKSKVEAHSGDEGQTTYHPKLRFEYVVDQVTHESDRYSFDNMNGSADYANQVVKDHRVGSLHDCFYDPEEPDEAVLVRELQQTSIWMTLFPFVFIVIGVVVGTIAVLGIGFKKKNQSSVSGKIKASASKFAANKISAQPPPASDFHPEDKKDQEWSVPQKLKSETSRLTLFLIVLGVTIFWNGIVSFFVFGMLFDQDWIWAKIILGLFLTPFVLIGLVMFGVVVYTLGTLFNPKIEVAMSSGAVPLGGDVDIAWELNGRASKIKNLKIEIQGEQSATYRRGTDTHEEREVFEVIPICNTENQSDIQFGSATVTIPSDTMHSFAANRNEVVWSIVVRGTIAWWPDVFETFPFRVKPN